MKIVTIEEAQAQLLALLEAVEATGEPVLICRQGTPVADLVPHRSRSRLVPHPVMQHIRLDDDPTTPLDEVIHTVLRTGLVHLETRPPTQAPYRLTPVCLGPHLPDLDNIAEILAIAEREGFR